ncbi:MAG: hypothetical protein IJK74_06560 [Bacteroidales bacterium]|nr:hypothetical protein [Bacteroidales bacterium]
MEKSVKERIIDILDNTFKILDNCYKNNGEALGKADYNASGSRIIFPCYSDGERRISEQELRFVFVEQLLKYCKDKKWDAYYSVETPTEWKYRFSGEQKPHKTKDGQSAMVDVCIHDKNGKRLCLIEFKAGNPDKFCYVKDLVKLYEEGRLGFFVQLLESQNSGTQESIESEIKEDIKDLNYICHTLPSEKCNSKYHRTEYLSKDRIAKEWWKQWIITIEN